MDEEGSDFRTRIVGFLDEFYYDSDPRSQRERLEEEPPVLGVRTFDAYIGAIGEHLCRRWILGDPPGWTDRACRFLKRPYFMEAEHMKPFLLKESPSAFRRRFIFIEAEPLRRASMPRDGRWWAYEARRSGMRPGTDDVAPSRTLATMPETHDR